MNGARNFISRVASDLSRNRTDQDCLVSNGDDPSGDGVEGKGSGYQEIAPQPRADGGRVEKPSITAWDASWNMSNAIQGMFVLGLPYALLHGGYLGLFLIIFTSFVCYYTGSILVDCLYETDENGIKKRVRTTYTDVAVACLGKYLGSLIVNTSQLIELLMTCVLYIVVSGNLMASSFPHAAIKEIGWSVIATFVLVPCVFLRHLRAVSRLSMACSIAQLAVLGITMVYCFTKIKTWAWSQMNFTVDTKEFPVSIGVIVFSYTSQVFLPTLEGSMERRESFKPMLFWSYVASFVTKALFALVCFLTWAEHTKDVVTDNLPPGLRAAVNLVLVIKALLSYPLPYYQSLEVIEQQFFTGATGGWGSLLGRKRNAYDELDEGPTAPIVQSTSFVTSQSPTPSSESEDERRHLKKVSLTVEEENKQQSRGFPSCYAATGDLQIWALVLRGLLVFGTLLMAAFIPHFALLMGLTGSFTGTLLAFLLPCGFHIRLKWTELSWRQVALDAAICVGGALCGTVGIYYSIIGLYEMYNPSSVAFQSSSSLFVANQSSYNGPEWFPDFPLREGYESDYDVIPLALPGDDVISTSLSNFTTATSGASMLLQNILDATRGSLAPSGGEN